MVETPSSSSFINSFKFDYQDLQRSEGGESSRLSQKRYRVERKRRLKSKEQIGILTCAYMKNPNWSRDFIDYIAVKIGLSPYQVYKWNWDKKKSIQSTTAVASYTSFPAQ
jgi:hypothetical protein